MTGTTGTAFSAAGGTVGAAFAAVSAAADDADDVSSAARSERRVGYATGAAVDSGEEARPPKRLPRLSEPSGSVKSSSGVAPEQTT
tara:strand:- start:73532 stop:73789 length:258 start_codon:yes stop_codon:yes gene_type:complete